MIVYQLKRLSDSVMLPTTQKPVWAEGFWDTGVGRYTDILQDQYADGTEGHDLQTPITFHNSFSVSERIKLKANADPLVQEFWKTFQLAASQPGEMIDPDSTAVVGGLAYIAGATSAPAPVIDPANQVLASAARIAQIQAGTPGGF